MVQLYEQKCDLFEQIAQLKGFLLFSHITFAAKLFVTLWIIKILLSFMNLWANSNKIGSWIDQFHKLLQYSFSSLCFKALAHSQNSNWLFPIMTRGDVSLQWSCYVESYFMFVFCNMIFPMLFSWKHGITKCTIERLFAIMYCSSMN